MSRIGADQPAGIGYELNLTWEPSLSQRQIQSVVSLAQAAAEVDGSPPLSEAALLRLRGTQDRHLLGTDPRTGALLGYGFLHAAAGSDHESPPNSFDWAELAVLPGQWRAQVGAALVAELGLRYPSTALWVHGRNSAAHLHARTAGMSPERTLLQMVRDLSEPICAPHFEVGVRIRPFIIGADEAPWLAANAEIFSELPDQGSWTAGDLAARIAAQWFDPGDFLLAVDNHDDILGFHWMKVLNRCDHDGAPNLTGEVYIVGVSPAARGTGLGRALTLAGLKHLREVGMGTAILYVDAANTAAVSLYKTLGFTLSDTDVAYRR